MPFQKGPCGEGGRMRGFLLPLLEEAAVVVLVLFLLIFEFLNFWVSSHNTKVNKIIFWEAHKKRREKTFALDGPVEEREM